MMEIYRHKSDEDYGIDNTAIIIVKKKKKTTRTATHWYQFYITGSHERPEYRYLKA